MKNSKYVEQRKNDISNICILTIVWCSTHNEIDKRSRHDETLPKSTKIMHENKRRSLFPVIT